MFRIPRRANTLVVLALFIFLGGCATYQGKVRKARLALSEDPNKAVQLLEKPAETEGKDQLVYLFDYGTALQLNGDYRKSIDVLIQADRMSEIKDYTSITKEATSLLISEEFVQYKGDDYEKVLVNAMLAINFLLMGDLDGALVETRRINEKLEYYRIEAKRPYEQNVFAVYLSALIWESNKDWDDAYIAFEKAYKLDPTIELLKEDLVRAALNARRIESAKKWQKEFGITPKKEWRNRENGELVLLFQQGWGPRKYPHPNWRRIPKLYPVNSFTSGAELEFIETEERIPTQKIYSVEDVAIKTMDDYYAPLIAKRMAAIVAKEVASDQIRQKNELLGAIANIAMHVADRADLRQWSTLPESFQIAKKTLPPGKYKVRVWGTEATGSTTGEASEDMEVEIKPGKKSFITWRSFQ